MMMSKNLNHEREPLEMLTIDQLVPSNHLVRKMDAALDFSFIYPMIEEAKPEFLKSMLY